MRSSPLLNLSLFILAIMTISLAGCSSKVESNPTTLSNESAIPRKTGISSSSVSSNTPIASPGTEQENNAVISTETPGPPMPTVVATLTAKEKQALVWDLLKNNTGCKLPCWWGFTPGTTEWQEVLNIFTSFNLTPQPYKNTFSIKFDFPERGFHIGQTYTISSQGIIETIKVGVSVLRNDQIVYSDPIYEQELDAFRLSTLLSNYGKPQEILLRTYPWAREAGDTPFYLVVNYLQLGFSMLYEGKVDRENSQYMICPQHAGFDVFLWSPEKSTKAVVETARQNQFLEDDSGYRKLDEATGLSLEEFYEIFKNTQNEACLRTPSDYWEP